MRGERCGGSIMTVTERTAQKTYDLERKADLYDALYGDPGAQTLLTLFEWQQAVQGVVRTAGTLERRMERFAAHIANRLSS